MPSSDIQNFTPLLIEWSAANSRNHPWKETDDPYRIWLSEIILQQTRVDQGTPYYLKFIAKYPKIELLANATEDEVLKLWEGLGYYSRARNLHETAKTILAKYNGVFPKTYKEILSLKGIGPYTAAAICSFAYKLPYAVVDGNVTRVLTRYLGFENDVSLKETQQSIKDTAQLFLDKNNPDLYNQAIMDFGATVCVPKKPDCHSCPIQESCSAFFSGKVSMIPFKSKKVLKKTRYLHYHIFSSDKEILIRKRDTSGIWKGLYEFYLKEGANERSAPITSIQGSLSAIVRNLSLVKESKVITHILTHQTLLCRFYVYSVAFYKKGDRQGIHPFNLVNKKKLSTFAFPRIIQKHILEKNII